MSSTKASIVWPKFTKRSQCSVFFWYPFNVRCRCRASPQCSVDRVVSLEVSWEVRPSEELLTTYLMC